MWLPVLLMWFLGSSVLVETRSNRQMAIKSCPEGYEVNFNDDTGKLGCTCKAYHIYWPEDGLCYKELSQGPCPKGHAFTWNTTEEKSECRCPNLWSLNSKDGACYEDFSRGPCEEGLLFVEGVCRCDDKMLMHYFPEFKACYPLYSQGPCPDGHRIIFDYKLTKPACACRENHVKWSDGKCYALNSKGPCPASLCTVTSDTKSRHKNVVPCFLQNLDTLTTNCTCLPEESVTEQGTCYQPYNQGPCEFGSWLVYKPEHQPVCETKKFCTRFDNWYLWPADNFCYRQYTQGPCKEGQLFYLDPQTGVASCTCNPDWKPYYWLSNGKCYEQDSIGPCAAGMFFGYNASTQIAGCHCFANFVSNPDTNTCVEKSTQGPCPEGQLVTVDPHKGTLKCDCQAETMSQYFWTATQKCYEHFTTGPCQEPLQFRLNERTSKPDCLSPIGRRKRRNLSPYYKDLPRF